MSSNPTRVTIKITLARKATISTAISKTLKHIAIKKQRNFTAYQLKVYLPTYIFIKQKSFANNQYGTKFSSKSFFEQGTVAAVLTLRHHIAQSRHSKAV